jgi:hypothetical protein
MSAKRIVKSHEDITMTEVTLSDGKANISPGATKQFGDMGATYFEELILQRLNPKQ